MNAHERTVETILAIFRDFAVASLSVPDADVTAATNAVSMAKSVGFMFDPTAYRKALYNGSLDRQESVLRLFARTRGELSNIFPDVAAVLEAIE